MLNNLSTSGKLLLLGLLSLTAIAIVGVLGAWSLNTLSGQAQRTLRGAERDSAIMLAIKGAQSNFLIQIQEWKNILIRGNDGESHEKHLKSFTERAAATQAQLKRAQALMRERNLPDTAIDRLIGAHGELGKRYREALDAFSRDDPEAGKQVDKRVRGMDRSTVAGMEQLVAEVESALSRRIGDEIAESERLGGETKRLFAAIALASAAT